jgi:hypothetical protein
LARPRTTLHDLLATAAERLEALGEPSELAAAVREAREKLFTRANRANPGNPTLPLYLLRATWERAQAAGPTTDSIEAGFTALLAGRFKPKPLPQGGEKGRYSSRASAEQMAAVAAYVEAHAEDLGWTPSPSQVAAAWLEHKYGKPVRKK